MTRETVMVATPASEAMSSRVGWRGPGLAALPVGGKRDLHGLDLVWPGGNHQLPAGRCHDHGLAALLHEVGFHSSGGWAGQLQPHLGRLALEFVEAEDQPVVILRLLQDSENHVAGIDTRKARLRLPGAAVRLRADRDR